MGVLRIWVSVKGLGFADDLRDNRWQGGDQALTNPSQKDPGTAAGFGHGGARSAGQAGDAHNIDLN